MKNYPMYLNLYGSVMQIRNMFNDSCVRDYIRTH